jgi:Na+-driven multidrug efflux pump
VQATLAWALRLPLVWILGVGLGGGVLGAWCGELGYLCVLALALVARFRAGHWRTVRL